MERVRRLRQALTSLDRGQAFRLASLTGLFFLIISALGVLRPIKNALALTGLAEGQFYKVYLVSAAVVLFVPLFNRVADRVPWRRLLPLSAVGFALLLVGLRAWYGAGSALFGLLFYGWYDLIAAVLVTQFFMATQLLFDAQEAKKFYPVVIAGGSLGATLGGAFTGYATDRVGLPNLMLVASGLILAFAVILPLLWRDEELEMEGVEVIESETDAGDGGLRDIARVFGNRQVLLITLAVLLTVVIKQLVDYQFNTIAEQVYVTEEGISEFQGWFNAGTQWLPLMVLVGLGPVLRRWGVGVVLFMFPLFMVAANVGLAATWALAAAVIAKGGDTAIRYAAERTSREILYVPIPEDLKLRAKGWIDVAVEKGVGKALSALVIFGLLQVMSFRSVGWVAAALAGGGVALSVLLRREYVESLARSLEKGIASVRGVYASLADAQGLPLLRRILQEEDASHVAFALDLLDRSSPEDRHALSAELRDLLDHPEAGIRRRSLEVLTAEPGNVEEEHVRARLRDEDPSVREAAVEALAAPGRDQEAETRLRELLDSPHAGVRRAVLTVLARGTLDVAPTSVLGPDHELAPGERVEDRPAEERLELALAAGASSHEPAAARQRLATLMADPELEVAAAALRSAGWLGTPELDRQLVASLGRPGVRAAAADALVDRGAAALPVLAERLLDGGEDEGVRRHVPAVLARIPGQETVDALLASYAAPETDQLLDYRTLKALNKLRDRAPSEYRFDGETVRGVLGREVDAFRRYGRAASVLGKAADRGPGLRLLTRSVAEAREKRREAAFRCLGLVLPPQEVYRSYLAVTRGDRKARANAMEWLEYEGDRALCELVQPVLDDDRGATTGAGSARSVLARLARDKDRWIARCSLWAAAELLPDEESELLDDFQPPDPHLQQLAIRLREGSWGPAAASTAGGTEMDTIEKVFLLQDVDVLAGAESARLALVAEMAEELRAEEDAVLLERGRPSPAMYVLVDGEVALRGESQELRLDGRGAAFGTWALIDEEPSVVDARATEPSRLLRVRRSRFQDLLADYPELAADLLQGLSRRMRRILAG